MAWPWHYHGKCLASIIGPMLVPQRFFTINSSPWTKPRNSIGDIFNHALIQKRWDEVVGERCRKHIHNYAYFKSHWNKEYIINFQNLFQVNITPHNGHLI
jgi:hypothetical protein